MKKDVIYIDIDDDVTAIIEKLKSSSEKIVALVPPKGSAVLQSVVNLKLLKRAADSVNKQTVVVTNNQAMQTLAGSLGIYIAKNLQSRPTLPGAAAEALSGDELEVSDEVGDLEDEDIDLNDGDVELSEEELAALDDTEDGTGSVPLNAAADKKTKKSGKNKVPNFNSFRKKLLIGGGIALLLIVVLLLIFGRSKANVVIRAETTPVDVLFDATVDTAFTQSNPDQAQIRAIPQEQKKSVTQSFTPTGKKDVGEKATGRVRFSSDSFSALLSGINIPAGTTLTGSGGKRFVTNESASLTATPGGNQKTVNVTAADSGESFNGISGNVSGAPSSASASLVGSTSGGTTRVVTVVSQDDINKATDALRQQDSSAVRTELSDAFDKGVKPLEDTFVVTLASVTSEPGVDQESNEGRITAEATYSMLGIKSDDLSNAINVFVNGEMTEPDQQSVYDNGFENVKLERKSGTATNSVYSVSSLAQYGPEFNTDEIAEDISGDKVGEARSSLQSLPGVKSVDIDLSPFWSNKLPGASKIQIKIDVDKSVRG